MSCKKCKNIVDQRDIPHVIRQCEGCGRKLYIHEPGAHGIGFKIEKGDKVVIPKEFLKLSLNPLKSSGQLTRYGLHWFSEKIHLEELPSMKNKIDGEIDRLEERCNQILGNSCLLNGLDISNSADSKQVIDKLKKNQDSVEWLALNMGTFISILRDSMKQNDIQQTVWAMGCVERFRSMILFKEHLEEVVWMGQSAKRIVDLLHVWDGNRDNSDERFWQITLNNNVYAISQVFAVPLVFIEENAYVGGMKVDSKSARLVDYLFKHESSQRAVLVEIKTPATKLLGSKYRGTFRPSKDLSGAIAQILDYRHSLAKNYSSVMEGSDHRLSDFAPKCVVIIGNGTNELNNEHKRNAFELFRSNSSIVEIVTYDELFRKLEILASLFNLTRTKEH